MSETKTREALRQVLNKPIHKLTVSERYKFYRQWHNRFYASILAIDIVYWINGAIVIGIVAGTILL